MKKLSVLILLVICLPLAGQPVNRT
ncbi:MAG: hypothetical protein H6Q19_259, partial [Bacteroidetes bacterium]|nr:hypothetical protein [Bacteroidota bacterium]